MIEFGRKFSFHSYRPAALLRVAGEDALAFLQGQFTQELRGGPERASRYGLWLNQKGKLLADSTVLRVSETECWIFSVESSSVIIRERLEAYIIADDVTIEDFSERAAGIALSGSVEPWLVQQGAALPASGAFAELPGGGLIFRGRRAAEESWECVYPSRDGVMYPNNQYAIEWDATTMERRRIEARIPAVPREVGPDDLPQEAGLEHDAISFTKGCYLGQEVMARLHAMGRVRRQLTQVRGGVKPSFALPAPLHANGKKVGELRSMAETEDGFIGLAMLTLALVPESRELSLAVDPTAAVTVVGA